MELYQFECIVLEAVSMTYVMVGVHNDCDAESCGGATAIHW